MSPKLPSIMQEKWFRGFIPFRADEPPHSFARIMGSAHTHKGLHTGRNPVRYIKAHKFSNLAVYKIPEMALSPAVDFPQIYQKVSEPLNSSVYKKEASSRS